MSTINEESRKQYILLIGNPGVGKSTLLNALIGRKAFPVGDDNTSPATGERLTKRLKLAKEEPPGGGLTTTTTTTIHNYQHLQFVEEPPGSNVFYGDTPGLTDIPSCEEAAKEIVKALKQNNNDGIYKLVFVVTGENIPEHVETINIILDAIQLENDYFDDNTPIPYGIIVNNVPYDDRSSQNKLKRVLGLLELGYDGISGISAIKSKTQTRFDLLQKDNEQMKIFQENFTQAHPTNQFHFYLYDEALEDGIDRLLEDNETNERLQFLSDVEMNSHHPLVKVSNNINSQWLETKVKIGSDDKIIKTLHDTQLQALRKFLNALDGLDIMKNKKNPSSKVSDINPQKSSLQEEMEIGSNNDDEKNNKTLLHDMPLPALSAPPSHMGKEVQDSKPSPRLLRSSDDDSYIELFTSKAWACGDDYSRGHKEIPFLQIPRLSEQVHSVTLTFQWHCDNPGGWEDFLPTGGRLWVIQRKRNMPLDPSQRFYGGNIVWESGSAPKCKKPQEVTFSITSPDNLYQLWFRVGTGFGEHTLYLYDGRLQLLGVGGHPIGQSVGVMTEQDQPQLEFGPVNVIGLHKSIGRVGVDVFETTISTTDFDDSNNDGKLDCLDSKPTNVSNIRTQMSEEAKLPDQAFLFNLPDLGDPAEISAARPAHSAYSSSSSVLLAPTTIPEDSMLNFADSLATLLAESLPEIPEKKAVSLGNYQDDAIMIKPEDRKQPPEEVMRCIDLDADSEHLPVATNDDCHSKLLWHNNAVSLLSTWLIFTDSSFMNENSTEHNRLHVAYAYLRELVQKTLFHNSRSTIVKDQEDEFSIMDNQHRAEGWTQVHSLWQACQETHENVIHRIEKDDERNGKVADFKELVSQCFIIPLLQCLSIRRTESKQQLLEHAIFCGQRLLFAIRDEILVSCGMRSVLHVFETCSSNAFPERRFTAALAIVHLTPLANYIDASSIMDILECIHIVSDCPTVCDNFQKKMKDDCYEAACWALYVLWINYLDDEFNELLSDNDPDYTRRKLLEGTICLTVDMIGKGSHSSSSLLLRTIVEHICRLEVARPLAVRHGILPILFDWSKSQNYDDIRVSQSCRNDLEKDNPYLKGWIEAEMAFLSSVQRNPSRVVTSLVPVHPTARTTVDDSKMTALSSAPFVQKDDQTNRLASTKPDVEKECGRELNSTESSTHINSGFDISVGDIPQSEPTEINIASGGSDSKAVLYQPQISEVELDKKDQQRPRVKPPVPHFQPSPGARITYRELLQFPEQILPEEHFEPVIHRAVTYPADVRVNFYGHPPVYLMRQVGATEAYALIGEPPIQIQEHGGWGEILFAVIYTRTNDMPFHTFQVPREENAQYVAIKRLDKANVNEYLRQGGRENPYREISRMRELGDNEHVLRCIDALEDDQYLYIVTPKACDEGTLLDVIGRAPVDNVRARAIFIKILKILAYLEACGICHRGFIPDNFLFLTQDNLVVFNLAMSHRLPVNEAGRRVLSPPLGRFGSFPYMPPEVFQDRVFDGVHVDLWAAAVILYNLLTRKVLYAMPIPTDPGFHFNILARGLSDTPIKEDIRENLTPAAAELLGNVLHFDFRKRWCLAQAMESDYVELGD